MNDSARTSPAIPCSKTSPETPPENPSKPAARRWLPALLLVSFGSVLAWAWSALPPSLVRGPYLQNASASGITVVFRTSTAATSTLRYGTHAGPPWDHEVTGASATTHVIQVTGLRPGTRYAYEIASGGAQLAGGPECSFQTSPPDNSRAPLRFVAWGDSGNGSSAQLAVAARMEEVVPPPALALGLGDLVYENGEWENYDPHLFRPYDGLFRDTTFWPTMGNHDYKTENGAPYRDAFHLPTQSGAPGRPSGTELYYSFDHGMAHFVCLDSESSSSSPGSAMYTWLADDLDDARARGKRWLIAFMHHPPYSKGTHDSDDESDLVTLRRNLVPLFESKGVDLVLVGHSHVYERSFLAKNDGILQSHASDYTKIGSPDGTLYVVSGCGGESGDGSLDHPLMAVSRGDVTGFNLFDVTYSELRGSFVERDGRTTDLFAVHKAADAVPPRVAYAEPRSATAVELVFDEPVQGGASGGGAENLAHYQLNLGAVIDASLATDLRTVTLTTTAMPIGRLRQIHVRGVADTTGNVDVAGETLALLLAAPAAASGGTPVVPQGSTWRYARGSTAPLAAWRTPGFDDSGWSQGQAGFGYGDSDDATVLADMRNGYATVYLRTRFTLADLPTVTGLALNVSYDDGFVAFLNGVEVARANVPSGQTSTTFASGSHEVNGFEAFDLGAFLGALVSGTNVLAVEGHNSGLDSADFSLHPELVFQRSAGGGGSASPPVPVLDCEVQEANVPALVSFSARRSLAPAGQGMGYAWGFGDGTSGFGPLVQHLYDRAGTYTVTLFLRGAQGQQAIAQRTIRVHASGTAPVARLTASSMQIAPGGRVDFDSAGSLDPDGGPLYVHWDFGEPARGTMNESTQARPSHVYAAAGQYAVTLAVTDDEGSTVTKFVVITVR